MKHLFIINPIAGGMKDPAALSARISGLMAGRDEDFELYTTRGPMDACAKAQQEADLCDRLRVYACGGDGTLNECVCGAAGRGNVALTHYPTGTGNDFIKVFGSEAERFRDLAALVDGETRAFDLIDCNGRKSLNICSVGIDARIGCDVHKYSALPLLGGATAYVTSTAVNLIKGVNRPLRVKFGERFFSGPMTLVCCCNGNHYGGGFQPVPEARPDDGVLDFLVVKGVSRIRFAAVVGAYAKGRYADYPDLITHLRGERMDILSEEELVVNMDGEAIRGRQISFRLEPGALNFIVPRGMAYFR